MEIALLDKGLLINYYNDIFLYTNLQFTNKEKSMYKNYAEYAKARVENIKSLIQFIPELEACVEMMDDFLSEAVKCGPIFDKVKLAIENALGKEIEFAECDTIFAVISSVMTGKIDYSLVNEPADIGRLTIIEIAKVLPGTGIEGVSESIVEITNKMLGHAKDLM